MFNHANQIIGEEENVHIFFSKQFFRLRWARKMVLAKMVYVIKLSFKYWKKHYLTFFSVCDMYRAFHSFGQAKIVNGGFVLGLSQFPVLPQLPYKIMLGSNEVKMESKTII